MTNFNNAGLAVHAYFRYYNTTETAPYRLILRRLREILSEHPEFIYMPSLTKSFLKNLRACWIYLYELTQETDMYCLEAKLPGRFSFLEGKSTDIIAIHRQRFSLIEVKSFMATPTKSRKLFTHAHKQVLETTSYLRHETKGRCDVLGYVLIFIFPFDNSALIVEWIEVCETPSV